jgi:hypothetical protein
VGVDGGRDHDAVIAMVGDALSSFLYPGWCRSLLPSALAHAHTLPLRFSMMFMSDLSAVWRSVGVRDAALTGL